MAQTGTYKRCPGCGDTAPGSAPVCLACGYAFTATKPGTYPEWLEQVKRLLQVHRPDVNPDELDPNESYRAYRKGVTPRRFVGTTLPIAPGNRQSGTFGDEWILVFFACAMLQMGLGLVPHWLALVASILLLGVEIWITVELVKRGSQLGKIFGGIFVGLLTVTFLYGFFFGLIASTAR